MVSNTHIETDETPASDAEGSAVPAPDKDGAEEKEESWLGFSLFLLKLIIAVLIFRSFIFSPFSIPSESMLPRFYNGDYLLASKWSYGFSKYSLPVNLPLGQGRVFAGQPDRGDMVIFKHPIDETDYIKRVIALPGDTISVLGGQVVLNGKLLDRVAIDDFVQPVDQLMLDAQQDLRDRGFAAESPCASVKFEEVSDAGVRQCRYPRFRETLPSGRTYEVLDFGLQMSGDSMDEVTIPEGKMFVMGDNRDNSQDSRFEARSEGAVGIVSQDALVGEATIIMWSTDGSAEWIKPWTWFSAARWGRIGSIL